LDQSLVEEARRNNLEIDIMSFIETTPVRDIVLEKEIENALHQTAVVVFTSMNAVDAVASRLKEQKPDWKIFCIGYTTRQLAENYFGKQSIAGIANSASELAEVIADEGNTSDVIFFCGDQRRDELPDGLRSHDIRVKEIIVYQTTNQPHLVDKGYQGILFFSPSAVESFFTNNKVSDKTVFFAIGMTTASAIKKYSANQVIISDEPGKENLVHIAIDFFSKQKQTRDN
jgi:uroporphyrinogen-III synthase